MATPIIIPITKTVNCIVQNETTYCEKSKGTPPPPEVVLFLAVFFLLAMIIGAVKFYLEDGVMGAFMGSMLGLLIATLVTFLLFSFAAAFSYGLGL